MKNIMYKFQKFLLFIYLFSQKANRLLKLNRKQNLAAQFHSKNTALANAFPGERNEHSKLHDEAHPPTHFLELEVTGRVLLRQRGRRESTIVVFVVFLTCLLGYDVAFGFGRGVECPEGEVSAVKRWGEI